MHRYYAHIGKTYRYRNKKDLISDLCEDLQSSKKEYKRMPLHLYHKFELMYDKHIEWWEFEIIIRDTFTVQKCHVDIGTENGVIGVDYCCIPNVQGESDNVFRNITEFREFLNREIDKEEQ